MMVCFTFAKLIKNQTIELLDSLFILCILRMMVNILVFIIVIIIQNVGG